MNNVIKISRKRPDRVRAVSPAAGHKGFEPCSPDMTICGDCSDNRAKNKCPRLREWLAKQNR